MYVRVGSNPAQGAPEAEDDEAPALQGAVGRVRGGLAGVGEQVQAARALLDRPLTSYYLIAGITTLLLCLGLVMVLSTASSPTSARQVALPRLRGAAGRHRGRRPGHVGGGALAAPAVPGGGVPAAGGIRDRALPDADPRRGASQNGATRWIALGPLTFQPSELAKLALAVWGADLLARKEKLGMLNDWRHMLVPLLPGTGVLAMLVMAGDDLGTTLILLVIFLALLWIIGAPGRVFVGLLTFMLLVRAAARGDAKLPGQAAHRVPGHRPAPTRRAPTCRPSRAATRSAPAGSSAWAWARAARNGAGCPSPPATSSSRSSARNSAWSARCCVTALYGGLAFAGLRVARRAPDTFSRLLSAAITAWIVGQAVVNIGAVIGVIPITGVPLPLVSQGLSSVLVTMLGLGMLMSFARREPGASQALAARRTSPEGAP